MRAIPGYPDYFATEKGEIISTRSGSEIKLKQRLHKGYLHVNIFIGKGKQKKLKKEPVHKLVLLAFKGEKPTPQHQCRHLNGNPLDNRPSNLEWGTASENAQDAIRHGTAVCLRKGEKHPRSKLTETQVKEIYQLAHSGIPYIQIAQRYSIHPKHVKDIKDKRTWKHLWGRAG